jgi:2-oxo-3-hexenedioate decarboxylase
MNLQDIARDVLEVLGTGRQLDPFSKVYPDFGLKDAYSVTAAVRAEREARGERPIGRKIGFTNRTLWAEYGVYAPIWGYVYDGTVRELTSEPLEVSLKGLAEPRIEPEIMFGLAAPPEPGMDEHALIRCIDWIAHGFEIVQSIFPNWSFQAADTVAGYGLHGRLLSDRVIRRRHDATNGRASSRASRSTCSVTEPTSITASRPMSSTDPCSLCAISPRHWRKILRAPR